MNTYSVHSLTPLLYCILLLVHHRIFIPGDGSKRCPNNSLLAVLKTAVRSNFSHEGGVPSSGLHVSCGRSAILSSLGMEDFLFWPSRAVPPAWSHTRYDSPCNAWKEYPLISSLNPSTLLKDLKMKSEGIPFKRRVKSQRRQMPSFGSLLSAIYRIDCAPSEKVSFFPSANHIETGGFPVPEFRVRSSEFRSSGTPFLKIPRNL